MRIAIIGAGASGLTAIKCCKDEGMSPVCFEQEQNIGGLWYFTEKDRPTVSSVYRSTVINTSKEMMCFSDFPIPKDFPPFMHNKYVMKYFHLYAQNFDLLKYIQFGTKILDVKPAQNYDDTGRWELKYCGCGETTSINEVKTELFDGVLVCTGHLWKTSWPDFPGMKDFCGLQMHSHSYKDFKPFEDKNVLVVGIGNSGGDISVELSRHASNVYLSTRRGTWVMSRLYKGGVPLDQFGNTRFLNLFPLALREYLARSAANDKFNHVDYGLQPNHSILGQHPMINDDLPQRILAGTLILKPNVSYFTKSGVVFEDNTKESLDAVIFCTGYEIGFEFLNPSIVSVNKNNVLLYKYVFPPQLTKPTLAVLGCIQPLGAINPLAELQARWATRVFRGEVKLPTQSAMMKDIATKNVKMCQRFYESKRHTIEVDYIDYADEIADLVGCRPNLVKLFFQDPVLAIKCLFGPCVPAQYRLMGPGAWKGAKSTIELAPKNIIAATKTRTLTRDKARTPVLSHFVKVFAALIAVIAIGLTLALG